MCQGNRGSHVNVIFTLGLRSLLVFGLVSDLLSKIKCVVLLCDTLRSTNCFVNDAVWDVD